MSAPLINFSVLEPALSAQRTANGWCVALSGGVDSCVLLRLLCDWREQDDSLPPLRAIHVNHNMQAAAAQFALACEALCAALAVPFDVVEVEVAAHRDGPEAAARAQRYAALAAQVRPGELLLTAHHLDDQVETVLLRLLRGAGARGLAGIPTQRTLPDSDVAVMRPLLDVTREQIRQYAQSRGLAYVEDPSNCDLTLDRNYLRLQVLPLLEARWPGYRGTISRAAQNLGPVLRLLSWGQSYPLVSHH